ncbi:MAG: alpha/beta family hydrolase [Gemmatimonadales bacterium]
MDSIRDISIDLPSGGALPGLLLQPSSAHTLYVMAHGAGAGMRHPFLTSLAGLLAGEGIGTLRFQFPYTDAGRRRPDPPAVLQHAVCAAVRTAASVAPALRLVAGGKSLGGRMTSSAAAHEALPVAGLIFLGFPLHAPGTPGTSRAEHLALVDRPMLFLQGTRDALARLDLIREVCGGLGERATLHAVEGGDHSFHVLKRSGRTDADVLEELARAISRWVERL